MCDDLLQVTASQGGMEMLTGHKSTNSGAIHSLRL
jgi:hypothetical protein